jgi:glycosyltransferase involved in cell wall biosynthesis
MNDQNKKTILMVALDYPPCRNAGVQRTLKFSEYLAKLGWQVIVLTVDEKVYSVTDNDVNAPENVHVYRCHSFDSSRDFAIKGKYFSWSQIPDRWWSWAISAVPLGKKLIDKYRPDIIWSTYPVSTAHYIAYKLQKESSIPWVADYRDPLQCRYDKKVQKYSFVAKWIEKKTVQNCTKSVFTTEQAAQLYRRLYPNEKLAKFIVIENGFDEGNFKDIHVINKAKGGVYSLLHSGAIYDNGRNPNKLFHAISELHHEGFLDENNFELVFRGASKVRYASQIKKLNITNLVHFKDSVPYHESLSEMAATSSLLLIQGVLFKNQIPGKAYEYIRCNKPILALTPKFGATGELLSKVNGTNIVEEVDEIKGAITKLLINREYIVRESACFSRQEKTKELDLLLRWLVEV